MHLEDLKKENEEIVSALSRAYGDDSTKSFLNDVVTYGAAYSINANDLLQKLYKATPLKGLDDIIFALRDTLELIQEFKLAQDLSLKQFFCEIEKEKPFVSPKKTLKIVKEMKALCEIEFDAFIQKFGFFDGVKYFIKLGKYSADHKRDIKDDMTVFVFVAPDNNPDELIEKFHDDPSCLEELFEDYPESQDESISSDSSMSSESAYNAPTEGGTPTTGDSPSFSDIDN